MHARFRHCRRIASLVLVLLATIGPVAGYAGEILVAVSANYFRTAVEIAREFESQSGHTVLFSSGSTGRLYSQIVHGAPFDVFLAADNEVTRRLEEEGRVLAGTRRVYATGRLALVSSGRFSPVSELVDLLGNATGGRIAVANPDTAPYGRAAIEVLDRIGIGNSAFSRLVFGENVGQVYSYVMTGNADYGLVALSYALREDTHLKGYIAVPEALHSPIVQEVVLLDIAEDHHPAHEFHTFLFSTLARDISMSHGYGSGMTDG